MSSPDMNNSGAMASGSGGGDKITPIIKQGTFPIDLAPKIALVKPTDAKGGTVQTQFRTLTQQPMRVVVPGTANAQIIQTQIMPQTMLKQVDALGRTQITALPSRTMAQTSITVTRPLTSNTIMPRGITSGPRATIRAQTPPSVANIATSFVRGSIPPREPRTPSPAGTVIPTAATWMTGNQPVQLIRTNIGHSPRATISQSPRTKIEAGNIVTQSGGAANTIQSVPQQQSNQNVSSSGGSGTYVATIATVLPPRHQTATLVYSNPQQIGSNIGGPRLAVANSIANQRQAVRPIQISNARLPTAGINRVSAGNISIRGPVPLQTGTTSNVGSAVSGSNLTMANLPAARIIQVQQQNPGGPAQVLGTGRITGNLMTLHPLVMNTSTVSSANTKMNNASTAKPSLTITHVGKVTTSTSNVVPRPSANTTSALSNVQLATTNLPQGGTITSSVSSQSATVVSHQTQAQHSQGSAAPIGIVMGNNNNQSVGASQIAQIVNINQSGINVAHGHQIQIIGSQGNQQTSTVVPINITSRAAHQSLGGASITTIPASVATNLSQIVRGTIVTSANTNTANNACNVLPMKAKVMTQLGSDVPNISVGNAQNVYVHSRPTSNPPNAQTATVVNLANRSADNMSTSALIASSGVGNNRVYTINSPSAAGIGNLSNPIIPVSSTAVLQSISTNTSSITTNVSSRSGDISTSAVPSSSNTTSITASYGHAPQPGSFAVVPASNRGSSSATSFSATVVPHGETQPIRFNPPLVVDGNKETDELLQKQICQQQISYISMASNQPNQMQAKVANIPVSSVKPATLAIAASSSPRSAIINPRKRDPSDYLPGVHQQLQSDHRMPSPMSRRESTDGSTTVSVPSSPGMEQMDHDDLNSFYQEQTKMQQQSAHQLQQQLQHVMPQALPTIYVDKGHSTNGGDDLSPRKRARKQQLSEYSSQNIKRFPLDAHPQQQQVFGGLPYTETAPNINYLPIAEAAPNQLPPQMCNDENSPPKNISYYIKRPKTISLLDAYKQSWKSTNNHFLRYSDVKPREDRRSTVVDLANQAHVLQKVNGWKIYHLTSQMEDLSELETQVYDKLASMLQCMEAHDQNTDVDRVNELIKGNMQRSKIVTESINEARSQILKVFDHKIHVSDIIHRCASKRNLKKREKP